MATLGLVDLFIVVGYNLEVSSDSLSLYGSANSCCGSDGHIMAAWK